MMPAAHMLFAAGLTVGMCVGFLIFHAAWDPSFAPPIVAWIIFFVGIAVGLFGAWRARGAVRELEKVVQGVLPYLEDMWAREIYEVPGPAIEALAVSVGEDWSHRSPEDDLQPRPPLSPH